MADGVAACWFPGSDSSSLSEDVSLLSLSGFLAPAAGVLAGGVLTAGVFLVEEAAPTALVLGAVLGAWAPSSLSSLDSVLDAAEGWALLGPGAPGVGVFEGTETVLRAVFAGFGVVTAVALAGGYGDEQNEYKLDLKLG